MKYQVGIYILCLHDIVIYIRFVLSTMRSNKIYSIIININNHTITSNFPSSIVPPYVLIRCFSLSHIYLVSRIQVPTDIWGFYLRREIINYLFLIYYSIL